VAADVAARSARAGPRPRLRCRRVEGPPVAAVRVLLPGGSRVEEVPGVALVCGRALIEGSRRRGWRQVFEEAEDRGVELDGLAGFEAVGLAIDCLASELDRALEWAAELALEPALAPDRVAWLAEQAAAELAALADQPEALAGLAFLHQLYDPNPRGRPLQGSRRSLERVDARECRRFHRRSLAAGAIVAVAGDLDEEAIGRRFEALFGVVVEAAEPAELAEPAESAEPAAPPPPAGTGQRRRTVAVGRVDQAHMVAGHLTVDRRHADLPALEVLSVILGAGAGLSGRIPERVRERDGLAYVAGAAAAAGAGLEPGRLEIYLSTSPDRLDRAERAVREELTRLLDEGPSEDEVRSARDYLTASEPFRFETARQWADLSARAALTGLPVDDIDWRRARWRQLGRPEVVAAARRNLAVDDLRVTLGVPGWPTVEV
jgi:zinc protease